MTPHSAESGLPERITFRLYPEGPHDVFAPSLAGDLVGTETRLQGRRVTVIDAEPIGDGGLLLTVVRVKPPETAAYIWHSPEGDKVLDPREVTRVTPPVSGVDS